MARERKTCSRCGDRHNKMHTWTLRPCAVGHEINGALCDRCDIELNAFILSFFRVKKRRELMEKYRAFVDAGLGGA